jgi:hypothetical protein
MLFLVVLHYKIRRRPARARVWPEPGPKLRPDASSGMVTGRIFWPEITEFFSARPEPRWSWASFRIHHASRVLNKLQTTMSRQEHLGTDLREGATHGPRQGRQVLGVLPIHLDCLGYNMCSLGGKLPDPSYVRGVEQTPDHNVEAGVYGHVLVDEPQSSTPFTCAVKERPAPGMCRMILFESVESTCPSSRSAVAASTTMRVIL